MIAALILLFASLDYPTKYQFVDVSKIEVNGDTSASVGERLRGEHIARFYEWLAESRWIMNECGAKIPSALSSWTPPSPHEIVSVQPSIDAYNVAAASNAVDSVRWVSGQNTYNEYLQCFSKSYTGPSTESVAEIADAAWNYFKDNIYWGYPSSVTMPTITSGTPIKATDINTINKRSLDSSYRWTKMGSQRDWSYGDGSYSTTVVSGGGGTHYEGSPLIISSEFGEWRSGTTSHLGLQMFDSTNGRFKFPLILKAENPFEHLTTTYTPSGGAALYGSNGKIDGRVGISIYQQSTYLFVCCWRVNYNSVLDMKMNARVYAKKYTLGGSETIGDILDGVLSRTPAPAGKTYNAYFVAILFCGHGVTEFSPNAWL